MSNDPLAGFPAPLGAPPRYEPDYAEPRESVLPREPKKPRVWLHFLLFGLTLLSMQATSMMLNQPAPARQSLMGWAAYQAIPLLGILLVHELWH